MGLWEFIFRGGYWCLWTWVCSIDDTPVDLWDLIHGDLHPLPTFDSADNIPISSRPKWKRTPGLVSKMFLPYWSLLTHTYPYYIVKFASILFQASCPSQHWPQRKSLGSEDWAHRALKEVEGSDASPKCDWTRQHSLNPNPRREFDDVRWFSQRTKAQVRSINSIHLVRLWLEGLHQRLHLDVPGPVEPIAALLGSAWEPFSWRGGWQWTKSS